MKSKLSSLSWKSTPIENIIQFDRVLYDKLIMDTMNLMMLKDGTSSKRFNKEKLGNPKFCFLNKLQRLRNCIWEDENQEWRAVVNRQGLTFEVPENYSPQQAYDSWKKYLNKVGLTI